jgi:nucleotide-binding universal stress UspA family protein
VKKQGLKKNKGSFSHSLAHQYFNTKKMSAKKILVPVEFSRVSEVSLGHATNIAIRIGAELHVMHLVDKESQISEGEAKLNEFLGKVKTQLPAVVPMLTEVKVGEILSDIGKTAEELKVEMVVMGTHGLQGMEYIVGTHAVRIVSTAEVPFIIVQERPIRDEGYKNIIVPMDLHSETKQKLEIVARMAKYFDSQIHLIIPHEKDEYLHNALQRNLTFAKTFLEARGVKYTAAMSKEDSGDLDEACIRLAVQKDADLIAIMNWRETRVLGIFGTDNTQDFIINKSMIPVMVVNPHLLGNFDLFGR